MYLLLQQYNQALKNLINATFNLGILNHLFYTKKSLIQHPIDTLLILLLCTTTFQMDETFSLWNESTSTFSHNWEYEVIFLIYASTPFGLRLTVKTKHQIEERDFRHCGCMGIFKHNHLWVLQRWLCIKICPKYSVNDFSVTENVLLRSEVRGNGLIGLRWNRTAA